MGFPSEFDIAAANIPIAILSRPVFPAQAIKARLPSINKRIASYLAAAGTHARKKVDLNEPRNMVTTQCRRYIDKLVTYVEPELNTRVFWSR